MEEIILASASPRRREILDKYKIKYSIIKSNIDEKTSIYDRAEVTAMSLAFQKAIDIGLSYPDRIILGADTIVVYKNRILGKAKNKEEAYEILKLLNGNTHKVITGISLIHIDRGIKLVDYDLTEVKFRRLSDTYIKKYINKENFLDKAGAYAIQDYGALLVESIKGPYLNVVGLPLVKLDSLFIKHYKKSIL